MDVHVCQHVPFEGPGAIAGWAMDRGTTLEVTRLDRGDALPDPGAHDLTVVLGGPMSVNEDAEHPWLPTEREFLLDVLAEGGGVFGVCLGAQQLAAALGAEVTAHDHQEIGWYPVEATPDAEGTVFDALPATYPTFHWHGDRFAVPEEATHVATSEACEPQAYVARDGRAVGVQFHLEATPDSVERLVEAGGVPDGGPWVQDRETILAADAPYDQLREHLYALLDELVTTIR